jgi:hypothetical protein
MYLDPGKGKIKYGLWENGTRVKWFDEHTVKMISQNTFDYTILFGNPQSNHFIFDNAQFMKPPDFEASL